jgi:uncharacterized membrane protein YdjX (TVP38/TMEM64 family)
MHRTRLIPIVAGLIVCGIVTALLIYIPPSKWELDTISSWMAPHRHAWYALPMVMAAFVALALVPVLLLIAATGIAFGPVMGPIYAMAGCLASGSMGFAIGRGLGRRRVERLGGERAARLTRTLRRNGTLAVFLLRKIPAPYILANIVVGASAVRYRDFVFGTFLGMAGLVIGLAGFGHQLTMVLRRPAPDTMAVAVLIVGIPLTLAWLINRSLSRSAA